MTYLSILSKSGTILALAALAASAQPVDPPGRVARLNYQTGPVSLRPASVDDWSPAVPNYPLTTGDNLWTDRGGAVEIHAGSSVIRMQEMTALSFLNLDDRTIQISLTQGVIDVRVRDLREDEVFEVDTPNGAISLLRPGEYRILTDGDRAITDVTVRGGEAEVTAGGNAFPVHPAQMAEIVGADGHSYNLLGVDPPDGFERWCDDRDRAEEQLQSVRYVPRDMVGYEDLDHYGVWREVPQYGWVWQPTTVVVGWAPYRFGHWVWVAPWGWTWIDDAPWGFAPFHYGRWAFAGGAWLWVPRAVVAGPAVVAVRPVYAPALVAFVGGPNFGVSLSFGGGGGVAWFALGPGEVYRPAYHVSEVYVRNVNVTQVNVTDINVTNVRYVNQTVPGAVVAVNREAFVTARPVGQIATVVSVRDVERAQVVGAAPAIPPRSESLVSRTVVANRVVVRPSATVIQRTVAVRTAPPPPPVPFRAQQAALEANGGRPLEGAALNNLRSTAGPAPNAPRIRTVAPVGNTAPAFHNPPANNRPPAGFRPPGNPAPASAPAVQPPVRNDRPGPAPAPAAGAPIQNERPEQRPAPAARTARTAPPPAAQPPVRNDRPGPAPAARTAPPPAAQPPARNERPGPPPGPRAEPQQRGSQPQQRNENQRKEERKEEHER